MADDLETKDIQQALDRWRDSAAEKADRPDWFWSRQHARVMSEVNAPRRASVPKLAWASVAATIAIAIALLIPGQPDNHIQQQVQAQHEVQISDHDLMLAVERTLNAGTPSSLEPASLLAEEMNQALVSQVQSQKAKEKRYEN